MDTKSKIRITIFVVLAILVIIFLIQNAEVVEVQLYFWPISIPRSLLIIMSIGVGALANYIFLMRNIDRSSKRPENKRREASSD